MRLTMWLLLAGAALTTSLVAQPKSAPHQGPRSYLNWWQKAEMQAEFGLSDAAWQDVQEYFTQKTLLFNAERSEVIVANNRLTLLYNDPKQTSEAIEQFLQEHIYPHEEALIRMKHEFRLFIRSKLSDDALAAFTEKHPNFFKARWIPMSNSLIKKVDLK